jgi:hypothetical protein
MGDEPGGTGIRRRNEKIEELTGQIAKKRHQIEVDEAETRDIKAEIRYLERKIEREQRTPLVLKVGFLRLHKSINTQGVAKVFIAFHFIAITAGIILIFQPTPLQQLGIALVVGGLFAFGTLLSAIWSEIFENERALNDAISRDSSDQQLKAELEDRAQSLEKQLQQHRRTLPALLSSRRKERNRDRIELFGDSPLLPILAVMILSTAAILLLEAFKTMFKKSLASITPRLNHPHQASQQRRTSHDLTTGTPRTLTSLS